MSTYPGFSTERMDAVFASTSRVEAMAMVEAAVATAQAAAGDVPADIAAAIVAACAEQVDPSILADGWRTGTPVLGLLDAIRSRLPEAAGAFLHHNLTTQDIVDTATMMLIHDAIKHLEEMAEDAATALRRIIADGGTIATEARSFLQSAGVTTFGFRTARWLDQLDGANAAAADVVLPVQIGGLIGDRIGISDGVVEAVAGQLGLRPRRPWHTDRAPIINAVAVAAGYARWAGKVASDVAQLTQLGEVTTRAGGSSAAVGKQNPIDAMRAMAASEACLGTATTITAAKPHELERGLGAWHAEWFSVPLVFQAAGAAVEAITAALQSLRVQPSALSVSADRRQAAERYVAAVLSKSGSGK
jgi:3-carboxy-cis,cis-muconate cycloisomerase